MVAGLLLATVSGLFNFISFPLEVHAASVPELPRVYVDSSYPALSSSRMIRNVRSACAAGEANCFTSLQVALDQSVLGDEIIVESGMTITGPIKFKNKITGSGWIVVRTSKLAELPTAGRRVSPGQASLMPKIVSPGANVSGIVFERGAHNFRLVGIEVVKITGQNLVTLIDVGDYTANVLSDAPNNIVFDRMYVHGDSTSYLRRCFTLHSAATAIVDSYVNECHEKGAGDSQAIGGWNGPGPFKIVNNYLEGAAENMILGGDNPKIANLVPSDIEIRGNHFFKPLEWKTSQRWSIKNLFELKSARRVLIDGNVFENSWTDGQTGIGILLKSVNPGTCTWCVTEDITFTNNIIRNAEEALTINAVERSSGTLQNPLPANTILIRNNSFENISRRLFYVNGGASDVAFDHNTAVGGNTILLGSDAAVQNPNFEFTNNVVKRGTYGVGTGADEGKPTLDAKFAPYIFERNLLVNYSGGSDATIKNRYPMNTYVSTPSTVGFVNEASGDFRLGPSSAYRTLGTDGAALGADFAAISAATIYAVSGNGTAVVTNPTPTPAPTPVPTPTPTPTPTSVSIPTSQDIIIYANDVQDSWIHGAWSKITDSLAALGFKLKNPDAGLAKIVDPLVQPGNYFEVNFIAEANVPYHLWMRMNADNDLFSNDSVHVQFSDSLDANGSAAYRIGTSNSLPIVLEEGSSAGLSGWGWNDNDYGSLGTHVKFANSGSHTVRVQQREDDISIDQIVLSPQTFLTTRPGLTKSDSTILSRAINPVVQPTPVQPTLPTPTVSLTISPSSVIAGSASMLTWTSSNATNVSIDNQIGAVALSGSVSVNLAQTTTYTITAVNSAGIKMSSATVTVSTPPLGDTTAPVISSVVANSITSGSATISWSTNEPATAMIEYGTSTAYGKTTSLSPNLSILHSIQLKKLQYSTTYHYRVKSQDASGNVGVSLDQTLQTNARSSRAPKLGNVNTRAGSVILSWDEPLEYYQSIAIYRSTSGYLSAPDELQLLARTSESTYSDTNVTPGQTYYYSLFVYDGQSYSEPVNVDFTVASSSGGGSVQPPVVTLPSTPDPDSGTGPSINSYPGGLVFKYQSGSTVYVLENGYKRPITNYSVYQNRIAVIRPIITVPDSAVFPTGQFMDLRSGTVIKGTAPAIAVVINGSKYTFRSFDEFTGFGYSMAQVQKVDDNSIQRLTDAGSYVRPAGTVFKYANSSTVYYLEGGSSKRVFPSMAVYNLWQSSIKNVITIPSAETYPDGTIVAMPDGVQVRGSEATVYLVEAGRLRPFSSGEKFVSFGYKFTQVIRVSDSDLKLHSLGEIIK